MQTVHNAHTHKLQCDYADVDTTIAGIKMELAGTSQTDSVHPWP